MTVRALDRGSWIERLAAALTALAKAQEPYLQAYWQHHPRERGIVDGKDETPYPLDGLRMVYSHARHSGKLSGAAQRPAHGFDGFGDCPVLRPEALHEVRDVFSNRKSAHFRRLATYVSQLAEALGRAGRFALRDKVLDVAIALEGMYDQPKQGKSRAFAMWCR